MRIGLYPFPSSGDMSANLAHIRTGAALAAEQSVELLVFHECALCGYPPLETSMEAVTPEQVSAGLKQVATLAKDHAMHIAVGTVRFQRGTRYNSVMVFGPEGNLLGCYDKQALWGWDCDHFSRGAQPGVFDIGGVRVGFRICFDVRFPEPFRQLYRAGADLCIVCFSDTAEQPDRERYGLISAHLRTRAVENVMPVLSVNSLSRCQTAPVCVIDPGGTVLLEAPTGARQLLVWDFSPAADSFGSRGRRVNSDLFLELPGV